jgi:AcrR family transcriptional regulator
MPAALLSRSEVIERLLAVMRREGYDGASLSTLSQATGLGRSSLYHHFPDGKDQMVAAVLGHLEQVMEAHVLAPLQGDGTAAARLRRMCAAVNAFYAGGRESCLLAALGVGAAAKPFHPRIRRILERWIAAIAATLRDGGVTRTAARTRAEDAVARIEGALVLAHGLGDRSAFSRALRALPGELLQR